MKEPLEPKEIEIEKYSEEDYDDMLNDQGDVHVGGLTFSPSDIIKELDPTAYRCGFADFQEHETKYLCPICGEQHDDEEDAKWCCQDESDFEEEEEIEFEEDEEDEEDPDLPILRD